MSTPIEPLTPAIASLLHPEAPNPSFGGEHARIRVFHRSQIRRCEILLADALKNVDYWGTRLLSSQAALARLVREDENRAPA